jgi:integrase
VAIESWLRQLHRTNGEILANATKAKIRNIFSVIFNHAIRYEWLEQGKNPVTLVRQSATRRSDPQVLDYGEIQALLGQLSGSARLMVMLAVTTGLRRSELFALKWRDIDFGKMMVSVQRSVYLGMIGNCKTETSRRPVPLEPRVAADLWIWKETSKYNNPDDWIFASKAKSSTNPLCVARKGNKAGGRQSRYLKENRMAYLPAYIRYAACCQWREREGGSRAHAACKYKIHPGDLFTSSVDR